MYDEIDGAPAPRRRGRFSKLQLPLGILASLLCVGWLVLSTDWPGLRAALRLVDYPLVGLALAATLLSIFLRALRWRLMFHTQPSPGFRKLTAAILAGQALNVLIPARVGVVLRTTMLGAGRAAHTLGTLVAEQALDMLMMVALILLLLTQATLPEWWRGPGRAATFATAAALLAIALLFAGRHWVQRGLQHVAARWPHPRVTRLQGLSTQLMLGMDVVGRPLQLLAVLSCSLLIWALYGAVNYVLLLAVGLQPSLLAALFLLAVLQLGVAVPSSPGRIGVFHYLCVQALAVFDVAGSEALSFAVILHLISVILPLVLGMLLAWRLGLARKPA